MLQPCIWSFHKVGVQRNVNPFSPNGDRNKISLYIITTSSKIQVIRKKGSDHIHQG